MVCDDLERKNVFLSLIVPCFNEENAIGAFLCRVCSVLDGHGYDWEVIFIDDGSTDGTRETIKGYAGEERRIRGVFFARNFGKEAALTAGLEFTTGNICIPIDVDLQDPPEIIPEMVKKWRDGYDVVFATRSNRPTDPWLKRLSAKGFYWVYNKLSTSPAPAHAGDFRLIDERVVKVLRSLPERNRFMKGLFNWPGFRQTEVVYTRTNRKTGKSKFNYWKLWNFALDGITSFSTVPLRIWTYVGAGVAMFAFCYAVFLIARTLLYGIDVPGYASLMVVVLLLGGVQLITLGVIGEYLGRTYDETKRRPLYVIDKTVNVERDVYAEHSNVQVV